MHALSTAQQQALQRLAARHAIRNPRRAAGCCFMASLGFSMRAGNVADLPLIRWTVRGDADYKEHWAVRLNGELALDLTRVQVDGQTAVVKAIASYPATYTLAGEYPACVFLARPAVEPRQLEGLSIRTAMLMRWGMFRHDVRQAAAFRKLLEMWSGAAELERYLLMSLVTEARRRLASRRQRLQQALSRD